MKNLPDIVWAWASASPVRIHLEEDGYHLEDLEAEDLVMTYDELVAFCANEVKEIRQATGEKPYVMRNTAAQNDEYYFWSEEYPSYDESARLSAILGYDSYRIEEIK